MYLIDSPLPLRLPNAQVQLQAHYNHCGIAASENCLSAATFVRSVSAMKAWSICTERDFGRDPQAFHSLCRIELRECNLNRYLSAGSPVAMRHRLAIVP